MQEKGFIMMYLPPASSHLNPVELVWSLFKRLWRKELIQKGIKTTDELSAKQIRDLIPKVLSKLKASSVKKLRNGISAELMHKAWND